MNRTRQDVILQCLLAAIALTVAVFYFGRSTTAVEWMPGWTGAATALALLFGIFFVYRSMGALRGRFIALFAAALLAAPVLAWLTMQQA